MNNFNFLGSMIRPDGDCEKEIDRRLAMGRSAVGKLQKILKNHDIRLDPKIRLMRSLVFSIVLYGAEAWTLKTRSRKRIDAFEMLSWRRLLSITGPKGKPMQACLTEYTVQTVYSISFIEHNSHTSDTPHENQMTA